MQHEITERRPLLDANGNIAEPGYSKELLSVYDRNAVKAPGYRIKEWDYYAVVSNEYCVALTIADNSYMGLVSATIIDFTKPCERTVSQMSFMPRGKTGFPPTFREGNVVYEDKRVSMSFIKTEGRRELHCTFGDFADGETFTCDIELEDNAEEAMVIATPFEKPRHFYYNAKLNCMRAKGRAVLGGREYSFSPDSAFAVLDWGRGVWTYDNTWYWGSGSGLSADGRRVGFNIGYGFGDTSAASENMFFVEGRAHKLDGVRFNIPDNETGYTKPWTFTSNDGRFEMDFAPVIDRSSRINAGLILTDQHQVFGRFTGRAVLDDGSAVELKDFMGFAEKVRMKY